MYAAAPRRPLAHTPNRPLVLLLLLLGALAPLLLPRPLAVPTIRPAPAPLRRCAVGKE